MKQEIEKIPIEEILQQNGKYISITVGTSMYPMLRERKDTVIIGDKKGRLKKYDVPLYKQGEKYVLHRIIRVLPEEYVICGDNCLKKEYGIRDDQIIGVLVGFYRGNKKVKMQGIFYKLYTRIWTFIYPIRILIKRLFILIKKFKRRN